MSELKEREQLKSKAIEDTDFLKSKATEIRTILRSYFSDIQAFAPIDAALNTVTMNGTDYLDTGSMESLRNFYANFLNRFTIAARAFLHNQSNKNTQNELIESAKAFNEIIKSTTNEKKDTDIKTGGGVFVGGVDISQKIDTLAKRIENLENKPDEIIQALNGNLNHSSDIIKTITELSQKSEKTLENVIEFKEKTHEQNEKLVTKGTVQNSVSIG